ncbi:hypothetical protein ABW19_dt0203651 [Dactylella cylindrospora]|nr:hypothetical protein ABW19_dt0203651 [Dactylella cylindrospora]
MAPMTPSTAITPIAIPAFAPAEREDDEGVAVAETSVDDVSFGELSSVTVEAGGDVELVDDFVEVERGTMRVDIVVGGSGVQRSTENERMNAPIERHSPCRTAVASKEHHSSE